MSLITLFTLFFGLSLLYFSWRKASHKYLETVFKHRIYKLRDDLRSLAMDGKLDCESFAFRYFDHALSRIACDSYYISLPYMLFMELKNKKVHIEIEELHSQLNVECDAMPPLKDIRDQMSKSIWLYVKDQHKYSLLHVLVVLLDFIEKLKLGLANKLRKKFYNPRVVDNVIYFPSSVQSHSSHSLMA